MRAPSAAFEARGQNFQIERMPVGHSNQKTFQFLRESRQRKTRIHKFAAFFKMKRSEFDHFKISEQKRKFFPEDRETPRGPRAGDQKHGFFLNHHFFSEI